MGSGSSSFEVVRGRLDDALAEELFAFWAERGVLTAEQAKRRLAEVVCVARLDGQLVGACSAYQAAVEILGGRLFWIYRSLLDEPVVEQELAMIRTTFETLDAERHESSDGEPFGLCLLIAPVSRRRFSREAEWHDPRLIYAGYLEDGRQVRIAYFTDQVYVSTREGGWTPPPGFRIELFAEQDQVSREDVIELWTLFGVVPPAEAERRAEEVLVVATDRSAACLESPRRTWLATSSCERRFGITAPLSRRIGGRRTSRS